METTLAIVVLVIVLVLLGALIYAYVRASGPGALRAWFVAPASLRQTFGTLIAAGSTASHRTAADANLDGNHANAIATGRESQGALVVSDESPLVALREELGRDIRHARERQEQVDQRLQGVDVTLGELRMIPDELTDMMRKRDRRAARELKQLRHELEGVRRGATAAGARRDEAYADLYGHIARMEAALSTVINPMLLPGEPLQVPDEFVEDTLEWDNWDDVGEHAYAFGVAFNQTRLVLDPALAQEIEQFIATLRQALTGKVYPTVRRPDPTRAQLATMRSGLEAIVGALTPIRRQLEASWYEMDRPKLSVADEDLGPEADGENVDDDRE